MATRSKKSKPRTLGFKMNVLVTLAENVAGVSVRPRWTAMDIVNSCWPAEIIEIARRAHGVVDVGPNGRYTTVSEHGCTVILNMQTLGLCPLKAEPAPVGQEIAEDFKRIQEIEQSFGPVRRAINFLNEHATLGAARYYAPWLATLYPDHVIATYEPGRSHHDIDSICEILPDLRAATERVASALLAPAYTRPTSPGASVYCGVVALTFE